MFNIFRKPLVGTRRANVGYVNGFPVEGGNTQLLDELGRPIMASIQPASSDAMNLLPEGRRTTGAIMVFTNAQLFIANAQFNSDLILHEGLVYECMAQMIWTNNIINHAAYVFQVVPDMLTLPTGDT